MKASVVWGGMCLGQDAGLCVGAAPTALCILWPQSLWAGWALGMTLGVRGLCLKSHESWSEFIYTRELNSHVIAFILAEDNFINAAAVRYLDFWNEV